jgi:hypothetical protein
MSMITTSLSSTRYSIKLTSTSSTYVITSTLSFSRIRTSKVSKLKVIGIIFIIIIVQKCKKTTNVPSPVLIEMQDMRRNPTMHEAYNRSTFIYDLPLQTVQNLMVIMLTFKRPIKFFKIFKQLNFFNFKIN